MFTSEVSDSDLDTEFNSLTFDSVETTYWNGREWQLLNGEKNHRAAHAKVILESFDRLSSAKMKPMSSAGGSVSVEKDKDGSSEITAEVHVSTKSDDGNTSVTASGSGSIDNRGNSSGKVEVRVEHEF